MAALSIKQRALNQTTTRTTIEVFVSEIFAADNSWRAADFPDKLRHSSQAQQFTMGTKRVSKTKGKDKVTTTK